VIRCQITNGLAARDESAWIAGLSREADLIQIREPALTTRQLIGLVRRVLALGLRGRILVNDRLDVALAAGAGGVHIRSAGIAPQTVRSIAPEGFLVTVACHSEQDVRDAAGADYAILAPVFSPLSKVDTRRPLALEQLRRICAGIRTPVLALGGITVGNAADCLEAGATGVAGISLFSR
jgi:thiamine-phosphate pyrophosphorylase